MWLLAPNLLSAHGFSTRHGGVSRPPYDALNLDDREDDPRLVARNRELAVTSLGFDPARVSRLQQVHGTDVVRARPGVQTADAQVTDEAGVLLAIGTADCYPVLLEDPQAGVIGAAHAGWRGTVGRVAARTLEAMERLGARPERVRAAVGPGVSAACYPVGADVALAFEREGLAAAVVHGGTQPHLDLLAANTLVLHEAGVPRENVWAAGRCSTEPDFFSYRRDAGRTGRMWAVIGLPVPT